MDTKNDITKTTKLISLQCLCEMIPDHVQSGTELHRCLLLSDHISDKIILDINVSCPFATFPYTILKLDGALVIFINNIVTDIVSLVIK